MLASVTFYSTSQAHSLYKAVCLHATIPYSLHSPRLNESFLVLGPLCISSSSLVIMVAQPLLSVLAVTSAAAATPFSHTTPQSTLRDNVDGDQGLSSLQWGECWFSESVPIATPILCATLDVPLDYTKPEAGTLNLSLSKVQAVNEPVLGSILLNFGGPGYEAVQTLRLLEDLLLKYEPSPWIRAPYNPVLTLVAVSRAVIMI